jgi:hypothetical protein
MLPIVPSEYVIRQPKQYNWNPQENITAYELALCIPVLLTVHTWGVEFIIEALPEIARRHFEQVV